MALDTHFGADAWSTGVCAGMSAVWMRLHHAQPNASAATRVDTTTSFEGTTHAKVYQNLYETEHDDSWENSSAAHLDTKYALENKYPGLSSLHAQQPIDNLFKLDTHWSANHTLKKTAKAMSDLRGYANLVYEVEPDGEIHMMAMFRQPNTGRISFFDSNFGEFNFPSHKALSFLNAYRAKLVRENGNNPIRFSLSPVDISGSIRDTPLSSLGDDLQQRMREQ